MIPSQDITVASKGLLKPQSMFIDIHTENMYILDFDKKETYETANPLSYRIHLWKKNEDIGTIIISEFVEYVLGDSYHPVASDKEIDIYV
ncbi:hypothetical protein I4U23_003623 [Adineta vaga]|nr:hypothetical protein I4U23_003623 [Adineta vaga]